MFKKLLTSLGLIKEEEISFTPFKETRKKTTASKTVKKPAKKAPTKKSK